MIFNIIKRNIKKNKERYIPLLLTQILMFALVNALICFSNSKYVMELAENMKVIKGATIIISIVFILVSLYITEYVVNFTVDERKKEIGLLCLNGLSKLKVSTIIFLEIVIVSIFSLILSSPLSIIFQLILNTVIGSLYDTDALKVIYFSTYSLKFSMLYFTTMQLFDLGLIMIKLHSLDIYDLITFQEKVIRIEKDTKKNPKKSLAGYIVVMLAGIMFFVISSIITTNLAILTYLMSFALMMIGVFGTSYNTILLILEFRFNRQKKTNGIVIYRNFMSRENVNLKSSAMFSILLFTSLICMFLGFSMSYVYKDNIKSEAPYDISVGLYKPDFDFNSVIEFVDQKFQIKDIADFEIYENGDKSLIERDSYDDYLLLSDYNKIRQMLNYEQIVLEKDEFIIHCEEWAIRDELLKKMHIDNKITIDNTVIANKKNVVLNETIGQWGLLGNEYIIVVPDSHKDFLMSKKSRLIINTKLEVDEKFKHELRKFINSDERFLEDNRDRIVNCDKITLNVSVKSWTIKNGLAGLSTMVVFSIYIGIILIIASMTLISLQQIKLMNSYHQQDKIIDIMGYDHKQRVGLLKANLNMYFLLPTIIPVAYVTGLSLIIQYLYGKFSIMPDVFIISLIITLIIMSMILFAYNKITYKVLEKSILNQ